MSLPRKKLPIGIQNLREIREGGALLRGQKRLRRAPRHGGEILLPLPPRPRRFGKSLFWDTLKELFEANRPLFDGLYAADHWDC